MALLIIPCYRWTVKPSETQDSVDDHFTYLELLKDNSAIVTVIENERVTSLGHFQVTV